MLHRERGIFFKVNMMGGQSRRAALFLDIVLTFFKKKLPFFKSSGLDPSSSFSLGVEGWLLLHRTGGDFFFLAAPSNCKPQHHIHLQGEGLQGTVLQHCFQFLRPRPVSNRTLRRIVKCAHLGNGKVCLLMWTLCQQLDGARFFKLTLAGFFNSLQRMLVMKERKKRSLFPMA